MLGASSGGRSSPLTLSLNSRMPRPRERPSSGSRLAPNTMTITMAMSRRWRGFSKPVYRLESVCLARFVRSVYPFLSSSDHDPPGDGRAVLACARAERRGRGRAQAIARDHHAQEALGPPAGAARASSLSNRRAGGPCGSPLNTRAGVPCPDLPRPCHPRSAPSGRRSRGRRRRHRPCRERSSPSRPCA